MKKSKIQKMIERTLRSYKKTFGKKVGRQGHKELRALLSCYKERNNG